MVECVKEEAADDLAEYTNYDKVYCSPLSPQTSLSLIPLLCSALCGEEGWELPSKVNQISG